MKDPLAPHAEDRVAETTMLRFIWSVTKNEHQHQHLLTLKQQ